MPKNEDAITIEIPITEYDVNVLMPEEIIENNGVLHWEFPTNDGKMVKICLMSEDEYNQRRK